jgi:hypothetical protein
MNVEIVAEAALFPEKEYISGIFVAVWYTLSPYPGLPCLLTLVYPVSYCISELFDLCNGFALPLPVLYLVSLTSL